MSTSRHPHRSPRRPDRPGRRGQGAARPRWCSSSSVTRRATRAPRSGTPEEPTACAQDAEAAGIDLYVHAPYIVNVATTNNRIRIPSRKLLQQHMDAAAEIGARGPDRPRRSRQQGRRPRQGLRQLAQGGRGDRHQDPAADREHRRRRQRDGPSPRPDRRGVGRDLRGRGFRPGRLLSRHLPRLGGRHRAGHRRGEGPLDHRPDRPRCTPTTAATPSTPAPTGTPTSATGSSTSTTSRASSATPEHRSSARPPVAQPSTRRTSRGCANTGSDAQPPGAAHRLGGRDAALGCGDGSADATGPASRTRLRARTRRAAAGDLRRRPLPVRRPAQARQGPRGTVVLLHGGCWQAGVRRRPSSSPWPSGSTDPGLRHLERGVPPDRRRRRRTEHLARRRGGRRPARRCRAPSRHHRPGRAGRPLGRRPPAAWAASRTAGPPVARRWCGREGRSRSPASSTLTRAGRRPGAGRDRQRFVGGRPAERTRALRRRRPRTAGPGILPGVGRARATTTRSSPPTRAPATSPPRRQPVAPRRRWWSPPTTPRSSTPTRRRSRPSRS